MKENTTLHKIFSETRLSEIFSIINQNKKLGILNLNTEAKALVLGLSGKKFIYVAKDMVSSTRLAEELNYFGGENLFLLCPFQNNLGLIDHSSLITYIYTLNRFISEENVNLIVTSDVLFQKLPTFDSLVKNSLRLSVGSEYKFNDLIKSLLDFGYVRVESVNSPMQFSVRGDVFEIACLGENNLVRIEFFDTEIEKITKLTLENKKFIENLNTFDVISSNIELSNQNLLAFVDQFNKKRNEQILVCFDEPVHLENLKQFFIRSYNSSVCGLENPEELTELADDTFISGSKIFECETPCQIAFASVQGKNFFKADDLLAFQTFATKKYVYNFPELATSINTYLGMGVDVVLFCEDEEKKRLLEEFLNKQRIFAISMEEFLSPNKKRASVAIACETFPFSVGIIDTQIVVIGCYDLFKKQQKVATSKTKNTVFYTPKVGDYVVHEFHGVGKCIGVEKLSLVGYERDYFVIEYAGGDKLYLPSEQANSISALAGNASPPKLNKLGGADFAKVKERVYKNVKKLAFDLLELYAKRENSKGTVYAPDDYLMQSFEDAFPYEETPDQLAAINDIKKDMESSRVMDRLVCGDVGYGKTEVALRAVYKAVISGKQVAILCPTTILAEQHYKTCLKRFNGFMVKTARLNRLVPKNEQEQILKGLADGSINVVCGTHKLLSSDVIFKDIGLLVLDEEQRFGVEDKEKIKNLKNNVDVLTLSATPIPRTLHMSLSGIRDISIIDTPPKERIPVQTFVTAFDQDLLVRAVQNELSRDGQVLIVFNRVEYIYQFLDFVKGLFPDVNIGVAHGSLSRKALEDAIFRLYSGQDRILIATTLIENGIDIPSANTLFVIDADKLGLSALYQLRGRIGRSNKTAYAYFTYNPDKTITETAFKRLEALMEFTDLGSGFKIAMRDLEIRGAGNVLGKEQHGELEKVGYDLYCKLLTDAIKELKGEAVNKRLDVKMDIALSAYISEDYIEDEGTRVKKYAQISGLNNSQDVKNMLLDFEKSFGKPAIPIINLAYIACLKNLVQNFGVSRVLISEKEAKLFVSWTDEQKTRLCQKLNLAKKEDKLDYSLSSLPAPKNSSNTALQSVLILEFDQTDVLWRVKTLAETLEKENSN